MDSTANDFPINVTATGRCSAFSWTLQGMGISVLGPTVEDLGFLRMAWSPSESGTADFRERVYVLARGGCQGAS